MFPNRAVEKAVDIAN
ncbi:unnamed protein product, partial [Didymodactylos carnosus]